MKTYQEIVTFQRNVFDKVASNCRCHFIPGFSICIDEQLMPLKSRCRFIVYMPNKPDKFGMKFWLAVDNETKYIYNIMPYLGALEKEARNGMKLADYVVKKLISPILNKAYNVTCDNYFTSLGLANELSNNKTTMVGTLRVNSKGIPTELKNEKLDLHASSFYYNAKNAVLLTKYQCKKQKSVFLLSTMHVNPYVDETNKRKPDLIHFYNKNKCGVDAADSMLRMYSCRCGSRRWPVAVWQNLLDVAVLNSWVCYRIATNSKITRKKFLMNLIIQLTSKQEPIDQANNIATTKRKCSIVMCKNKSQTTCRTCKKVLCGTHCDNPVEKIFLTVCSSCDNI